MLADIDLGGQEIEELERMRDTYAQRINRLTQQVEEQVSQLDRLRRAYNENIEAAERLRAEAQQADAEYERLLRERQQRDRDLKLLREQIAERTAILQGVIKQQRDLGDVQIDESALKPVPPRGGRPRLPGGSPRRLPDRRGDYGATPCGASAATPSSRPRPAVAGREALTPGPSPGRDLRSLGEGRG